MARKYCVVNKWIKDRKIKDRDYRAIHFIDGVNELLEKSGHDGALLSGTLLNYHDRNPGAKWNSPTMRAAIVVYTQGDIRQEMLPQPKAKGA